MKTRSILLYFPGYPFELKVLTPSRQLASLAGSLLDQGHETLVLDYGTVSTVDRLVAGKPLRHIEKLADDLMEVTPANPLQTLHMLWHMRCADKAFRDQRAAYAHEIAEHLASRRGIHFAAFMMNTVEDVISTLAVVRPLRKRCPRLRIVGFGQMATQFWEHLIRKENGFDCLCVDEPETALVALAERIDIPDLWHHIPNIASARGGQARLSPRDVSASLSTFPAPAYEPDVYPALKADQKVRVFTIDECKPLQSYSHAASQTDETPRVRSVASVCNEMWRIGTLFGARAFHFSAESAPASHVSAVAHELLRRGMSAVYTRSGSIENAVPATFPVLYTSGCVAMSFPIDTGSQRLLDTFYGRNFTITDVERVLRCSKSIGMFTIARFTYPCPADDYHTRAETLRVIERAKPHAAPVSYPRVVPGTRWHDEAVSYGYAPDKSRGDRHFMASARKFPMLPGAAPPPLCGAAELDEHEIYALHQALVRDIEQRGVVASLSEDALRLACIMGDAGRERDFGARLQRDFVRGDAMGIATLVDLVNEVACVSAKRMALSAPEAERLAVGN